MYTCVCASAIGTSAYGTQVLDFTLVNSVRNISYTSPYGGAPSSAILNGVIYYVTVKGTNCASLSTFATSDGTTSTHTRIANLSFAHSLQNRDSSMRTSDIGTAMHAVCRLQPRCGYAYGSPARDGSGGTCNNMTDGYACWFWLVCGIVWYCPQVRWWIPRLLLYTMLPFTIWTTQSYNTNTTYRT